MGKITYEIITTIKESEKGNIYLAVVPGYGLPLIVKKMNHGNEAALQKLKEIENIHIPKLYCYEKNEDGFCIFEEYVEGELLSEYLKSRKLKDEELVKLAIQLCEALEVLHESIPPIIHRDVKPSNVIVNSKGVLKLIDYDAARIFKSDMDGDTRLLGTEHYAPPEQYGFSQTDQRSDIYSLGVVLGKFPQLSSEKKQKIWKKIVERCTMFDPESRYQSVNEVKEALKKYVEEKSRGKQKLLGVVVGATVVFGSIGLVTTREDEYVLPEENLNMTLPIQNPQPAGELFEITPEAKENVATTSEPTEVPRLTMTPEPTEVPRLTLTPEPTEVPQVTMMLEQESDEERWYVSDKVFEEIEESEEPPEERALVTDSLQIKALKEQIKERQMAVAYYFKDRMQGKPYLSYIYFFEDEYAEIQSVCVTSYQTDTQDWLAGENYSLQDNILHVSGDYMTSLEEGYYRIDVEMYCGEERKSVGWGTVIYVSESDEWETTSYFLWNNYFELEKEKTQQLHFLLRNDVEDRISSLIWLGQGEVAPELYEILYDGRAIALSEELVSRCCKFDKMQFMVETENGLYQQVTLTTK